MMTIQDLVNAISTVGFPIACCIVLFYETHQNAKRREEELTQMRDILSENTNVLKELVEEIRTNKQ